MKTLSLLRHVDSDWGPKGSKDFDRVLSEVGHKQCLEVANYIETLKSQPDLVLCSTAKRTIETCKRVSAALNSIWHIQENEALYQCTSNQLIKKIQQVSDDCNHLLIIGHNPTLQEVSWLLSGKSDSTLMHDLEKSFPPGTLSTHSFACDSWSQIDKGRGILKGIFKI